MKYRPTLLYWLGIRHSVNRHKWKQIIDDDNNNNDNNDKRYTFDYSNLYKLYSVTIIIMAVWNWDGKNDKNIK